MNKPKAKASKPSKSPSLKDVAQQLATARKRLADADARREKAIEELARSITEVNDASLEAAQAEFAFEEAAIGQARKKFGLPDVDPDPGPLESCSCCPTIGRINPGGDFTFSIGKPFTALTPSGPFKFGGSVKITDHQ